MGNFNGLYMLSNGMKIFKFSVQVSSAGGIAFGVATFFILIIIAGFLIFYLHKNPSIEEEDTNLGKQKGIIKKT